MNAKTDQTIYWTLLVHENWRIYLAATSRGLCFVGTPNQPLEEMREWVEKHFSGSPLVQDDEKVQPYAAELIEYFQGIRKSFSIPFDVSGRPFQLAVWNALREIPYGQTSTYSDIALRIQKPSSSPGGRDSDWRESGAIHRTVSSGDRKKWIASQATGAVWM